MQGAERAYASAILRWSRHIEEHGLGWLDWQIKTFGTIIWP